jgi:hypothetical protein
MRKYAFAAALLLMGGAAQAAEETPPTKGGVCIDQATVKDVFDAKGIKWIQLTDAQWQFLRGIYAMNPETPPGLPYGDKAVLASPDGKSAGAIFFLDGDKVCGSMKAPKELIELMDDVATSTIRHEVGGL